MGGDLRSVIERQFGMGGVPIGMSGGTARQSPFDEAHKTSEELVRVAEELLGEIRARVSSLVGQEPLPGNNEGRIKPEHDGLAQRIKNNMQSAREFMSEMRRQIERL